MDGLLSNLFLVVLGALLAKLWPTKIDRRWFDVLKGLARRLATRPMLVLAVLLVLPLASPVYAADCNFEQGTDLKMVRWAAPASGGLNLGIIDVEAGYQWPDKLCGNVSVNLVTAVCAIPKINLPFCGGPPEPE